MTADIFVNENENQCYQKYLGERGLIVLIAFLSAFIPLSTDLYLPALPRMAESFEAAPSLVNLTLIMFFAFYAIATLFWGPLSDKYGRKRILIIGLIMYTLASGLCALSANVYQLIICRIFQAIASGAATSVAQAVVKDSYYGRKRVSVLALVSSMTMISPIVAPVVGALILRFTSWRGIFLLLTIVGFLILAAAIVMEETLGERYEGSIFQSLGRLSVVAKNPGFISLVFTFSIMQIAMMSFISSSSYIYVEQFGLSEQVYSYYFAANAFFLVIGPILYMRLSKFIKTSRIITLSYIISGLSGLLIVFIGSKSPWIFALSLFPASLAGSITRPPSAHLMLEQQKADTGAAVSLMSFAITVFSCVGMVIISLDWANRVTVMGFMFLIISVISLGFWSIIAQKSFVRKVLQSDQAA